MGRYDFTMDQRPLQGLWLDAEEDHAWHLYLRVSRLLEAKLDCDLLAYGLPLREYEILMVLSKAPDRRLRMSAIADHIVQSRSRLTHTASRLESRGWVRRESCVGDRRGVALVLTEAGYAEVVRMAPIHARSVRENLMDSLSRKDLLALARIMAVVAGDMENVEVQSVVECGEVGVPEEEIA
jgi:DNA-binding MarR family transcriptional regulator